MPPAPGAARAGPPAAPRLRTQAGWALAGNLFYAASQWLVLVVLAKAANASAVGQLTYALAVTAPVVMLLGLQLRSVLATDVGGTYLLADYARLRLVTSVLALLVIAGLAVAGPAEHAGLVLAAGLAKSVEAVGDLLGGAMQRDERMGAAAGALFVKGTLGLASFAAALLLGGSLLAAVLAQAAAWAVTSLAYDVPVATRGRPALLVGGSLRPARLAALARTSLPLGVAMALISWNVNVPRYFVERFSGSVALGLYGGVAYLFVAGSMVVSAVGQAVTPRLARHALEGDRTGFLRLTALICAGGAGLGLLGVAVAALAGRQLLELLYSAEYAGAEGLLVACALVAVAQFTLSGLGIAATAARSFRAQLPVLAAGLAVTAAGSAWLVPAHGALGAVWATGLSTLVQLAGYAPLVRAGARRPA